jgi:serine/threonine-protein kinase
MQLLAGQIIDGKYRIIDRIGQGGMGEVYRGEHIRIGRQVAIKVLYPECAQDLTLARFEREARAAARIGNDHILEVLDFGSLPDKAPYLVAELLDGLAAAHRADVLHRDLKPANVFLLREKAGRQDFVKIIDFGVSKFLSVSNDGLCVTATGALVGTPYYLAPELIESSHSADARCDLYAVGVIIS